MPAIDLIAFLGIALIVIVTPGQDTALTIRNTFMGRRPAGVATAGGVVTGQLIWALAASVGVAALLVAAEPAFVALKLAGAAYLAYLGLSAIRSAIRGDGVEDPGTDVRPAGLPWRVAYRQGLISNLGNPKVAVFFTTLLPQFAPAGDAAFGVMLGLGGVFAAITLAWLTGYTLVVDAAGGILRRPRVRRTLDAVMGVVLVALGLRLATASR